MSSIITTNTKRGKALTTMQRRVLHARGEDIPGNPGLTILPKIIFRDFAPAWLASWKRDGSNENQFQYDRPDGRLIRTHNELNPEKYESGTSRLDALCLDLFVSVLVQLSKTDSTRIVMESDWIFKYLGWKVENRYPHSRLRQAFNRLVNTDFWSIAQEEWDNGLEPEKFKLLDGTRSVKGGLIVTPSQGLLDTMRDAGTWGIGGGVDYISISRASSAKTKTRNQIAKLLYLMLRSSEVRGVAQVWYEHLQPLVEWDRQKTGAGRYHYSDPTDPRGRVGKALELLCRLGIVERVAIDPEKRVLKCDMRTQQVKIHKIPNEQQETMAWAQPDSAIKNLVSGVVEDLSVKKKTEKKRSRKGPEKRKNKQKVIDLPPDAGIEAPPPEQPGQDINSENKELMAAIRILLERRKSRELEHGEVEAIYEQVRQEMAQTDEAN